MKQFLTVLSFEFNKMQRSTVYRVITILVLAVIVIGFSMPSIIGLFTSKGETKPQNEADKQIVYVIDNTKTANAASYLAPILTKYKFEGTQEAKKDEITDKINNGTDKAYALLALSADGKAVLTVKQVNVTDTFVPQLQSALNLKHQDDQMSEFGLTKQQVQQVFTPPAFETVQSGGKDAQSSFAFTYILLILMFMSITIYGQMVTMSVITEKSSRTMELLVTSAKTENLIFGKIIGTGLAGLMQISLFMLTMFLMYQINGDSLKSIPFISALFTSSPQMLAYTVLYYLLGFFLYSFLLGALGSMCSRVEDANAMITPATLLLVAGFYIAIIGAVMNPNNILIVLCSMFPFFSPMVMLVRMGMTEVPFWQTALSLVLTAAGVYGMGRLSVMIYRVGVLIYGNKPSLKQIFITLKQAKKL